MPYPVAGYPWLQTARPQGTSTQLGAGDIDTQDVNSGLLFALNAIGAAIKKRITIISGYRTSAYSAQVGGFAGDPHTRGIAVDAYVGSTPVSQVPGVAQLLARYGLVSGNQPGFYQGQPDPPHIQLSTTTTPTGTPPATPSGTTAADWTTGVLKGLGAPVTARNIGFLHIWHTFEGGTAANNPLNTTQAAKGATEYNSAGVKNYPSAGVGIQATVQTLENGKYSSIVNALRSGDPWGFHHEDSVAANLRTWGTGTFASLWLGRDVPPGGLGSSTASGPVGAAIDAPFQAVGSGVSAAVGGITSVGDAIKWLGNNWDRVLEVIGGSILLGVGLYMLGRQMMGKDTDISKLLSGQIAASARDKGYSEGVEHGRMYEEEKASAATQKQADRATVKRQRNPHTATAYDDDIPF